MPRSALRPMFAQVKEFYLSSDSARNEELMLRSAVLAMALLLGLGVTPASASAIAWHGCATGREDELGRQLDDIGARCAEVKVPLDYTHPDGRTISVALARRPATDQAHRIGTLVVNTGGPGPSLDGVTTVQQGLPALAARYDVVGVDPRFFGRSTPLECGWPTNLYLQSAQYASPDRAAFRRSITVAKDLASRCKGFSDLLPHASTRNIARDLDAIRGALGEQRISYLGWSYGTYLGAVYTQLFPTHTDRVVLDSALNPDTYGADWTRDTAPADAAALADWARWAAGHPEYGLGTSKAAVLRQVTGIVQAAKHKPLRVGTFSIDATMIPGALLTVDDTDASYADFSAQVRVLRDAARGRTVTPTPTLADKLTLYNDPSVIPEFGFSASAATQCADRAAARDPQVYFRDIQQHRRTEPLYGPLARDIGPCSFWPTTPAEPATVIHNNRPALIISASGDPATPYAGQLALHRKLPASRQLTLANAFRHTLYPADQNPCINNTTTHYLLSGELPPADVTCTR